MLSLFVMYIVVFRGRDSSYDRHDPISSMNKPYLCVTLSLTQFRVFFLNAVLFRECWDYETNWLSGSIFFITVPSIFLLFALSKVPFPCLQAG